MKVAIQTLGCKVNQYESASMEGMLRNHDCEIVSQNENPDVMIINTCTVTAKSDCESRRLIRKAIRGGARVIATGCYAQLRPADLAQIEGLDLIIGNSGKQDIIRHLSRLSTNKGQPTTAIGIPSSIMNAHPYHSDRARAFLKIQDGCNASCSYCTVPLARGSSRSMDVRSILESMDQLCSAGYREVVLTGIHIGMYGSEYDNGRSLFHLVVKIANTYPDIRIRLSSIEPKEFDFSLLSFMKSGSVCRHLHIPLQSGSDGVLQRMNRGYNATFYKRLIKRILTDCPDVSIGTDIIAGFPGESDNDFESTVNLLNDLPFHYLHVFPYSKRPDTVAAGLPDQVSDQKRKERVRTLLALSAKKKYHFIGGQIGRILNVIVEKREPNTPYFKAISDNYLMIYLPSTELSPGDFRKIQVKSLTNGRLIGKLID